MFLIFITIRNDTYFKIISMFIVFYFTINFLMGNIVESHLKGYNSFCYDGIINYSRFLLINYLINFWITNIFMIISILSICACILNYYKCFDCNYNRESVNIDNNNISSENHDNLPIYQEIDYALPRYQDVVNNSNNLPSYSSIAIR